MMIAILSHIVEVLAPSMEASCVSNVRLTLCLPPARMHYSRSIDLAQRKGDWLFNLPFGSLQHVSIGQNRMRDQQCLGK